MRIEKLSKHFRASDGAQVAAVNEVSFEVQQGELLVLVGPSGSGKTTLLRMLAGLEQPTGGTIWLEGRVVNSLPPQERGIAMVMQDHALYPHLTVAENLGLGLKLRKVRTPEIKDKVGAAASVLELAHLLDRQPSALSGGERQRVALGRAMVLTPKVFLLDEPLSNLDAPLRVQMRQEILRLHRRLGTTMIYVTHDQVEAMSLADRIAVIHQGAIQQVAGPMELYSNPANLFVARFIGAPPMNLFPGLLLAGSDDALCFRGTAAAQGAGEFSFQIGARTASKLGSYVGKQVVLGLRPEDIRPAEPGESLSPELVVLEAPVEAIEAFGWETHVHFITAGTRWVARLLGACQAQAGKSMRLVWDLERAHFFEATSAGERLC